MRHTAMIMMYVVMMFKIILRFSIVDFDCNLGCFVPLLSAYKAMQAQKGIPVIYHTIQTCPIYETILIVTVFITIAATVAVHLGFLVLLF